MSSSNESETNNQAVNTETDPVVINEATTKGPELTTEEMKMLLRQLFGAMFSRPILSQILISSILRIPEVEAICKDESIIREILSENKNIIVTEEYIKSSIKPEQNTIILRDIPTSTPTEELVDIIVNSKRNDGTPCPPLQSIRADMNDTWFVTFATENEARSALQAISNAKFNDDKIRARLKTESLVKYQSSGPSYLPPNNNPPLVYQRTDATSPLTSVPGGIYFNPPNNFPVIPPPNYVNAGPGPQWNIVPPPNYIANQPPNIPIPTGAFMQINPNMNGFVHHNNIPNKNSPRNSYNNNSKMNNQRSNRYMNRNNSNNNLNMSNTPPLGQPIIPNMPPTGSPNRYNPPPQVINNPPNPQFRQFPDTSNENFIRVNNNHIINDNMSYYMPRGQPLPMHLMNEFVEVGNGVILSPYQIQLYQQQQMQLQQQLQLQHHQQQQMLQQQATNTTIIVDNNRSIDSPRAAESPRPNYIYFAGRTDPNTNNSSPRSNSSKISTSAITTTTNNTITTTNSNNNIEESLDVNTLTHVPKQSSISNQSIPSQYRPKKEKSDGFKDANITKSNNIEYTTNISIDQTSSSSNILNNNNDKDKDKYKNTKDRERDRGRDNRRKSNSNISNNRSKSEEKKINEKSNINKPIPKFNLDSDFPTLIDGEVQSCEISPSEVTSSTAPAQGFKGYAAALKRTVISSDLKNDPMNLSNNSLTVDSHIDEKLSNITASTDDDDLILPPQYKQAWELKKAANKINKKVISDNLDDIVDILPPTKQEINDANNNDVGLLAFGSFNPVLPDTNVKTVFGATPNKESNISPRSPRSPRPLNNKSNNNNNEEHNKSSSSLDNSKRSFRDALRSKT